MRLYTVLIVTISLLFIQLSIKTTKLFFLSNPWWDHLPSLSAKAPHLYLYVRLEEYCSTIFFFFSQSWETCKNCINKYKSQFRLRWQKTTTTKTYYPDGVTSLLGCLYNVCFFSCFLIHADEIILRLQLTDWMLSSGEDKDIWKCLGTFFELFEDFDLTEICLFWPCSVSNKWSYLLSFYLY